MKIQVNSEGKEKFISRFGKFVASDVETERQLTERQQYALSALVAFCAKAKIHIVSVEINDLSFLKVYHEIQLRRSTLKSLTAFCDGLRVFF